MSVKVLLARLEAGFISLHDVLTLMTQLDGASYEQAATLLHRLLWTNSPTAPNWWVNDKLRGVLLVSDQEAKDAWACLRQAAKEGEPSTDEIPF